SRRRHTRFSRDWSSDVCSSDLGSREYAWYLEWLHFAEGSAMSGALMELILQLSDAASPRAAHEHQRNAAMLTFVDSVLAERSYRSEERRVGKERRSRRAPDQ